ncbi:hypothetical protein M5K25_012409 [Dendrobium thyrsiflorum]|uniref:Uncharacterized protein n=1 Tax=Dendrobium thyrsiflorum TaxID=117978 RepID=A0ABD0UXD8_DENTH
MADREEFVYRRWRANDNRGSQLVHGRHKTFNKRLSSLCGVSERSFGVWKKWVRMHDKPNIFVQGNQSYIPQKAYEYRIEHSLVDHKENVPNYETLNSEGTKMIQ